MIEELRGTGAFTELGVKMNSVKWMRLAANRDKTVSEEKAAKVKAIREEVKGLVKDLAGQYFYQDAPGILEDLQICRPAMEELASLVREFAERFEERSAPKI